MTSPDTLNIASCLADAASRHPDKIAVHVPAGNKTYNTWTFRELNEESDCYAHGLREMGIGVNTRVLLMVPPGFDFMALTFALFKSGAIPVLIDPGMGKSNLLNCVIQSQPEAMIAIPKAYIARFIYSPYFRSVKRLVTVGRRYFWGGKTHKQLRSKNQGPFRIAETKASDTASIIFTTGSTGPPKGVVFHHGMFDAQVKMIRDHYGITENDIDMPAFPLFALFSAAIGMSVVIPNIDFTNPGSVNPKKYTDTINDKSITFTFGSPAIWRKVSRYCVENNVKLPTLKRVLMAGAPVESKIHERLLNGVLPDDGETYTPFGATESLPVCDIKGTEVLEVNSQNLDQGVCVGKQLPGMTVDIIEITDEPISDWENVSLMPKGEAGEIVVSGPVVSREYFNLPEQTRRSKIADKKSNVIKHRMGDIGYIDDNGRLWFLGRKSHRVVTSEKVMFTIPCEAIFNQHPDVFRTALVGIGDAPKQRPVIIAELREDSQMRNKDDIAAELIELGATDLLTSSIKDVLFHPDFPTDIRHNAKIFREKLKIWAEAKIEL